MAFSGIWNRYACCPENQSNWPTPGPNMLIFEVTGYNYKTIPDFFNHNANKMIPLQSSVNARALKYTYVFYQTIPPEDAFYFLATLEDIMPVVTDGKLREPYKVSRQQRHNGYTMWLLHK